MTQDRGVAAERTAARRPLAELVGRDSIERPDQVDAERAVPIGLCREDDPRLVHIVRVCAVDDVDPPLGQIGRLHDGIDTETVREITASKETAHVLLELSSGHVVIPQTLKAEWDASRESGGEPAARARGARQRQQRSASDGRWDIKGRAPLLGCARADTKKRTLGCAAIRKGLATITPRTRCRFSGSFDRHRDAGLVDEKMLHTE